jgi:glycosyltransferase involved in cell wall biosynthesis
MKVSLILPVRNEKDSVNETLESVFRQSKMPDEIVIADGCSTDATVALIGSFDAAGVPIKIVPNEKILPGAGRNAAIDEARYDVIAATDFGTVLDAHWLEEIIKPLEQDPSVDMVSGRCRPRVRNEFEKCVASVLHTANYYDLNRLSAGEIERAIAARPVMPGGLSVAFRRSIWRQAGGYPDWLRTSEDKLFARKVHRLGGKIAVSLKSVVYYDPRDKLANVFRQFYGYGKGNAQSGQSSWAFFKLLSKSALGLSLFIIGLLNSFWWYVLGLFVIFHLYRAGFKTYFVVNEKLPPLSGFLWIPLILMTHHAATVLGHSAGYLDRLLKPRYRKKHFDYINAKQVGASDAGPGER